MGDGIFLIQNDGKLVEMTEQEYDSEQVLQKLLADYPDLLAGSQIDSNNPRRWLLIAREFEVPSETDGGARWAIDHLFVDQDGIPTIVEVKRSSDTRIRREVVGQMIEYAANAVAFWPVERLQATFEEHCTKLIIDPSEEIANSLGPDADRTSLWATVQTNLQAGKIRLVFVADKVPSELRVIINFLNRQMSPGEIMALEIKQFIGQQHKTMIPRLVAGGTPPPPPTPGTWNETSFMAKLDEKYGAGAVRTAKAILQWAIEKQHLRIWWGKGAIMGSFYVMLDLGAPHWVISVWTHGNIQTQFQFMARRKPFDEKEKRDELRLKFNDIPGLSIPPEGTDRFPTFPIQLLANDVSLRKFFIVLDWIIEQYRSAQLAGD